MRLNRRINEQYIPYSQAVNQTGLLKQHIILERTKREKRNKTKQKSNL